MGTENVKLGEGMLYFDDTACPVSNIMIDGTDLNEIENPDTYITKTVNEFELTLTSTFNPCVIWTYDIIHACPNNRVKHLILTSKKARVVKKNFRRAIKLIYKEGRK